MKIHTAALITLASPALLFLLGCGGGSGASASSDPDLPAAYYACVINDGNAKSLTTYAVNDDTGAVEGPLKSTYSLSITPRRLVTHPTLPVVYFTTAENNRVYAFEIASANGALTRIDDDPTSEDPSSVAVTPDGTYLFVGSANGKIRAFSLDGSGRMTTNTDSTMVAGDRADELAASSQYIYALAKTPSPQLRAYTIGASGALSPGQTADLAGTPRDLAVHGDSVYVNTEGTTVLQYGGNLTPLSPAAANATGAGLASTVIGDHFYRSLAGANEVFAFSIAAGGTLTQLGGPALTMAARATRLTGRADRAFLYTVHNSNDTIGWSLRTSSTGALGTGGTLGVADSPVDMAVVKVR